MLLNKAFIITNKYKNYLILLGCILVSLFQILTINSYSSNFPITDDYSAILEPSLNFANEPNIKTFFTEVFKPHTQHLQVLLRIVAISFIEIFGFINFRFIIFLGSLWFLPIVISKFKSDQKLFALSLSLVLAQPLYSEASLWATNLPYLWVNTFAFFAFRSLHKKQIFYACLFALLAFLSWGSGLLVSVVILIYAIYTKSKKIFFSGLITFLSCLAILKLNKPSFNLYANTTLIDQIIYFLRLIGSGISFYQPDTSLVIGISIVLLTLYLLFRFFKAGNKEISVNHLFIFYLLISLIPIVIYRSDVADSAYTTSRYTLGSILIVILLLNELFQNKRILVYLAASFFVYANLNFFSYYDLRYYVAQTALTRFKIFSAFSTNIYPEYSDTILKNALGKIYHLPEQKIRTADLTKLNLESSLATFHIQFEDSIINKQNLLLTGYLKTDKPANNFYIKSKAKNSNASIAEFICQSVKRIDVKLHHRANHDISGFSCLITGDFSNYDNFFVVQYENKFYYKHLNHKPLL